METAHILREAVRETDVLGRLSGDEFVALLACGTDFNGESLLKRIEEAVVEHNDYQERNFKISISVGIALYNPQSPCSIEDLLVNADSIMYKQKMVKKGFGDPRVLDGMNNPVRSVLAEFLAGTQDETVVRLMIPLLRKYGVDAGLAFQLSYWVSKGSHGLKLSLIEMIDEMNDASGGTVLRMALFDDSEEIAVSAARVTGKIHFLRGLPALLKAAKIRENRFPENEAFLKAVCRSLGELAQPEGSSFLRDIAGGKPLRGSGTVSLPVRMEAIQALARVSGPENSGFLNGLTKEENPQLREALGKIIEESRPT
jgi:HEAT repeat protein